MIDPASPSPSDSVRKLPPFFDVFNFRFILKRLFIDLFWALHIIFGLGIAWIWKLWIFDYKIWGSGSKVDVLACTLFRLGPWDSYGASPETLAQYAPLPSDYEPITSFGWLLIPSTIIFVVYCMLLPRIIRSIATRMYDSAIRARLVILSYESLALTLMILAIPWISFHILPRFDINRYIVCGIIENKIQPYRMRDWLMRSGLASSSKFVRLNAYALLRWEDFRLHSQQLRKNLTFGDLNERIALLSATEGGAAQILTNPIEALLLSEILETNKNDPRIVSLVFFHMTNLPEDGLLAAAHVPLIENSVRSMHIPVILRGAVIGELIRLNDSMDPVDYLHQAKILSSSTSNEDSAIPPFDQAILFALATAVSPNETTRTAKLLFDWFASDPDRQYSSLAFDRLARSSEESRHYFFQRFSQWICDPKESNEDTKALYLRRFLEKNQYGAIEPDEAYYAAIAIIKDCGLISQRKQRLDTMVGNCNASTFGELMDCRLAERPHPQSSPILQ